ncbi:MAG: LysR family transcriptional regulator [Desmonostoc vinosum HA7617-LM4]|jgi:DNA-binding transcriptional LysR family regulator|nr:LysR family transcriptional regulator [Desmonostoc vinosum HA7617-LM4]
MEFRQLQYFLTVAEELNFSQAARRLNMAQPPLTRQIRQLEQELGVQLFKRNSRRVELTAVGSVFVEEARRILGQNEMQVLLGLVAAGLGVAILSGAAKQFQRTGVVYRQLQPSSSEIALAIAYQPRELSSVLSAFLEIIREISAPFQRGQS